ncbi:MAG: c-type cytochrome [Xanthobacteraceae bacterium]|nr:c-type cytochrome [Xanthobacteraceae bacterium]
MRRSSITKMLIERMSMKRSVQTLFFMACMFVAGVTIMNYCPGAAAQSTTLKPGDEFRAVYGTTALDIADGKRLAEASCAGCHGTNGISTTQGVPHLAGQRPAYLYLELKAYQSGARGDTAMNNAVKFLSDDALVKVAAYFASLDPVQSPATSGAKVAPAKPDPVQAGKSAAAGCAGCHGEAGVSKVPGMPSLVGLDPKYLVAAMKAYKSGQRKHDMMKSLLGAVSDADMNNIALYYALQKPARAETPATGNQAAGKAATAGCAGCHGDQGVSGNPATPSLAGQDAQYLAAALRAYKGGSRNDETMKGLMASLDENAIKNLSAYYATQQPQPPNVRKPLTTDEWVQRCDRCHGLNGNSTDPRLPALAGQRVEYLRNVLHDYRTRTRKSTEMAAMSDVLTEDDVENLAAFYARQKARAVVYVPLPSK